jgi:phosphoribosylformimino-5-aminoimidazole carboxamide ribotide isomerase
VELFPAIDLLQGKAVRLRQGRFDAVTVYADDPAELAARWRGNVQRMHVVDLEGSRAGQPVEIELVSRIVAAFGSGVQVGGGVRSLEALCAYFELGVERVVLGTAAVSEPELVAAASHAFPGRVVLAVDARGGRVATRGWLEQSEHAAIDVALRLGELPLAAVLYTDIERDGMETGPNLATTAALAEQSPFPVIASGGVGTLEHLHALCRAHPRIVGAVVGRALHEGRFSVEEAVRAADATPRS